MFQVLILTTTTNGVSSCVAAFSSPTLAEVAITKMELYNKISGFPRLTWIKLYS